MVFQIALDFVSHLVDRDPLNGRRQLFEDVLRLDSGPFGTRAEYGQSKVAYILFYFVVYLVIYFVIPRLLFGIEVRQANEEEVLGRFKDGLFLGRCICSSDSGDARSEILDIA